MRAFSALPRFISPPLALPLLLAACDDPQGLTQAGRTLCWQNMNAFTISCTKVVNSGVVTVPNPGRDPVQDIPGPVAAPRPITPNYPVTLTPAVARSASADEGQTSASQSSATEAAAAAAGSFGANSAYSTQTEAAASSANGTGGTSVSYTVNGKGYAVSVGENGPTITEIN